MNAQVASLRSAQSGDHTRPETEATASTQSSTGHKASALQQAELDHLIAWDDKLRRRMINDVKRAAAELNDMRVSNLQQHLQEKLTEAGVDDNATLEDIMEMVRSAMRPWQGMESENKEAAMRRVVYPHVSPRKRLLTSHGGKAGHTNKTRSTRFVYDMPVEEAIQQRWKAQPEDHQRTEQFLEEQVQLQHGAVFDDNWVIDDYYTSINGLEHPKLGKSSKYLGTHAAATPLPQAKWPDRVCQLRRWGGCGQECAWPIRWEEIHSCLHFGPPVLAPGGTADVAELAHCHSGFFH
jgi:hypothetical protein